MAYSKRTWKGRQGTGLNKFSIDGATPVTVVNQPDSVTEQGDALSAGNLNDLEDRIYDAFDDIADGTQIVGKATADASGNVITTTYATKSELTSEATARANADSNLLSAIQGNTARIENLEQEHGGYVPVNYRGTNAVPTGKAKYALVESIVGKSRAWNQLCPQVTNTTSARGYTVVSNGASTTVSGTSSSTGPADIIANIGTVISGHVYLVNLNLYVTSGAEPSSDTYGLKYSDGDPNRHYASSWRFTASGTYIDTCDLLIYVNSIGVATNFTITPNIYDLTLIFGSGNEPSTVADALAQLPALGQYNAYGYSLVDTVVEGVKSVGVNIWDEETEVGSLYFTDGTKNDTVTNALRSKNYITVRPDTSYYLIDPTNARSLRFCYYAEDGTFISASSWVGGITGYLTITTPPFCTKMLMAIDSAYGATYNHDIQICDNSLSDAIKQTYHPFMTDTLTLPTSVTLRSAGTVADTDELNVEVLVDGVKVNKRRQTTRIGTYTFTGNENWTIGDGYVYTPVGEAILPQDSVLGSQCLTDVPNATATIANNGAKRVALTLDTSTFDTKAKVQALVTGRNLYYALATESVTLLDPIINNTILTEGGGTINTIQNNVYPDESPAPTIDNSMDVGYLAL